MTDIAHIGINAVFLRPRMGGIETYVRRLVPELVAARPGTRFSLFLSGPGRELISCEPWAAEVDLVTHPLLGFPYGKALTEMTLLGRLARRRGVQLVHSVAYTGPLAGPPHVVTVGDLMWMREPAAVDRLTRLTWRAVVGPIARRAERVLTYSQASKRDVVELLRVPEERIDAVPLGPGADELPAPMDEAEVRRRHDLGEATVVLAGSGKRASKNLLRLVQGLPAIAAQHPGVVVVMPGEHTPYEDELRALARRLGMERHVRFPGYVDAAELEGMYRIAACFAFPSLYEGFGLPILEAMRRGVPVACSAASALPEVAGDAALYFDPMRPEEIAQAVIRILGDPDLAQGLVEAGIRRQGRFSWRATAEGTLEAFERARTARSR